MRRSQIQLPLINLNGTPVNRLYEAANDARIALSIAITALRNCEPHGRDYQTDPTGTCFDLARKQWLDSLEKVEDAYHYIVTVDDSLFDQRRPPIR